jgi:predicted RNA binding protein YcfA (HicA-like mRNA interferase family)
MPGRMRRLDASEVEALLARHGFTLVSQKGSHRKWRNDAAQLQVIVPLHKSRPLPLGTLRSILDGARIPEQEWR